MAGLISRLPAVTHNLPWRIPPTFAWIEIWKEENVSLCLERLCEIDTNPRL